MGSRPCESRNDLLNRWVRMKREERALKSWEKPSDPGTVNSLSDCERWRKRVCDDLNEKLEKLYNEPLPPAETRFLNDEANRTIQEIRRWEHRILQLGGIDYARVGYKTPEGDYLNSNLNQYQYFGRARNLPGVRELLEAEKQQKSELYAGSKKNNKIELMEKVDARYYGLYEDPDLEKQEKELEKALGLPETDLPPIISFGTLID